VSQAALGSSPGGLTISFRKRKKKTQRVKNEVIELKCNIHEEDLSDKYFQIERNHYDLVQDAHNRNREKELESTNNNLL
tara:strand:- start:25 stop:261 length:237 start_codon:yes stop_codon:yes gene_type:complete